MGKAISKADEFEVMSALAHAFFDVVPREYRTYCPLTSRVAQQVMQRFGFAWKLLPCQLWYAAPERNHVIGFTGGSGPGKWDGHVVCASDDWFIDAAVHHLHLELGINVPSLIAAPRFKIPSQAIARHDLNESERLWWHHAPAAADALSPEQPRELVESLAGALYEQTQRLLADSMAEAARA